MNDEDREIAEDQAKGVMSSRYQPGPYSPIKEKLVEHFVGLVHGAGYGTLRGTIGADIGDYPALPGRISALGHTQLTRLFGKTANFNVDSE